MPSRKAFRPRAPTNKLKVGICPAIGTLPSQTQWQSTTSLILCSYDDRNYMDRDQDILYWTSFLNQHCKVHLFCTSFATLRTVRSILTRSAKISRKKMSIFFTYISGSLPLQCIVTNYCCYKCKRWFSSPSCLFLRVERSLLEQPEDIDLAQSVFLHLFRKYVTTHHYY